MMNLAKFARALGHKARTEAMPWTVIQARFKSEKFLNLNLEHRISHKREACLEVVTWLVPSVKMSLRWTPPLLKKGTSFD